MRRAPLGWLLLAASVRALVALRTAVPDRDAAHYLWMAEQVAAGRMQGAFATVFHPLHSLLIAGLLVALPGIGPAAAGQLVSCGLGALAVWPLFVLTERSFGTSAANAAALFYAVGVWFARYCADGLSEGPFYLWVAVCIVALGKAGRRSALVAGTMAAVAYWTRPEGASLFLLGAPWLVLRGERARAVAFAGMFVVLAALLPIGYAVLGDGFTLTPKAAFNWEVGAGGAKEGGLVHYIDHLLRLPVAALEAIGYVALPMALVGVWLAWPLRGMTALWCALFALQVLVVPLLRSNIRFVSGYGMLMLPFAGLCWRQCRTWFSALHPAARVALVAIALGGDVVRLPQARRQDRVVLVELGGWLKERLQPGERIATEMPRLEYFAGSKPSPPRPITAAEIVAQARRSQTRWVVVVAPRTPVTAQEIEALGYHAVDLPARLRAMVRERALIVMERSEQGR